MNQRIKEIREINNLNKKQFADILEISPSAIGYIESGEKNPSIETVAKICIRFKIDANWLITGKRLSNNLIDGINSEGIKELNKYLEYLKTTYPDKKVEFDKVGNL